MTGAILYGTSMAVCLALFHAYLRVTRVPRWRRIWKQRRRAMMRDVVRMAKRDSLREGNVIQMRRARR